jgi:hypothetical protein
MSLAIALAGSGSITEKNAEALLNDFIGTPAEFRSVVVPNYITKEQEGLRIALDIIENGPWSADIIRVRKSMLLEKLKEQPAESYVLIIVGTDGYEELVDDARDQGIMVLDLCKALMQVADWTQMAPDGSESHAESLTEVPEGEHLGIRENRSESRVDTTGSCVVELWPVNEMTGMTKEEVEKIMAAMIAVHETRYHNGVKMDLIPAVDEPELKPVLPSPEVELPQPNAYRSKTGKLRKMGRSKARPGETEVHLSQAELDAL